MQIKKGEIVELEISEYAFEGKGIAKVSLDDNSEKKFVVFVNGAYPGDRVKVQIRKKKKTFAEGKVHEIIKPSPQRVKAECKFFGTCGGCKQQDLNYQSQLKYKEEQVHDIFERIAGIVDVEILPIIGADKTFYYRNKMEFSFSDKRWLTEDEVNKSGDIHDRNFALGLHIPRIYDKVLDIDECFLQSEESNKILNITREFFKSRNTSIYSTQTHTGYLRNLVIKQSHHEDELMVNLVTSTNDESLMKSYTHKLVEKVPQITTVINNVNEKKAQVAIGDYEKVYYGKGFIYDRIGNYKFRISPNSFFQTNTLQAEKLYKTALDFADLKGDEVVYDLYAGAGTITIFSADSAGKLYAFENIDSAVEDARINSELNKIDNITYINADLNKSIRPIVNAGKIPKPDVVISDPPRSGMNPRTVNDVISMNPGKLVYVSCNPATQARDIKLLIENGYSLVKLRPVDMFPHTHHIENVALIVKDKKSF